jgi:AraC family transcriptional regulator, arabinose operon regulatory protein
VPRLERNEVALVLPEAAPVASSAHQFWSQRLPSRFLSPRHAHGAHEVCWVLQGRCVLTVGENALGMQAGDACVVRPGEVHQLRPTPALEPFETLWWHVTANGINLIVAGFAVERYKVRGGFVPISLSPAPALARVVQELEGQRPRCGLIVRAILLELAAAILRHLDETGGPPITFASERESSRHVQRMARYIETHHGAGIKLEHLARVAQLSPYYLTRLFRHYTGRGAMTYLADVRHREARILLRDTDLAVAEVARSVGYDDPYYFSRVFKAREGFAPLYYRQRTRIESGRLSPR